MIITFTLDGNSRTIDVKPGLNAVKLLKNLDIDSVRNSDDGHGFAGSDTILLDGRIIGANLLIAAQLDGRDVKTVNSLRKGRKLSVVQQALIDAGCVQSGYNTPAAALMIVDLIERIPAPSRADVQDALSGLFNRATGYEQFFEAVRIAVAKTHDTEYAMPQVPEFGGNARYIGKRVTKVDALRLVAGEKAFVEDRVESGACIMKVLRSPHAHANIKRIDTAAAEALDGVVAVFTHANVPRKPYSQAGQGFPEPSPYDRVLIDNKVRHHGDRVAAVVAEDEEEETLLASDERLLLDELITLEELEDEVTSV